MWSSLQLYMQRRRGHEAGQHRTAPHRARSGNQGTLGTLGTRPTRVPRSRARGGPASMGRSLARVGAVRIAHTLRRRELGAQLRKGDSHRAVSVASPHPRPPLLHRGYSRTRTRTALGSYGRASRRSIRSPKGRCVSFSFGYPLCHRLQAPRCGATRTIHGLSRTRTHTATSVSYSLKNRPVPNVPKMTHADACVFWEV
ncbi:hypothetical protein T484DRAFT_1939948 [Baffinella frigidus]|nr:hypothetical protein T484DRAFT_1939948 [Cryptophyta sp. CCMP2293]